MAILITRATHIFAIRSVRLCVLVGLLVAMLASLTWQGMEFFRGFKNQPSLSSVASDASEIPSAESSKPSSSLLGLFGARSNDADVGAQPIEKLPESNLNLQVSAIFFMAHAAQSSVILEDGDRTMMLKPGEEARPGIVVQSIESHRITLKRNGKLEQISFKGFGEMPGGDSLGSPLPTVQQADATPAMNKTDDSEVIVQAPTANPSVASAAVDQNLPTAYQQYIQRKLTQNK